MKEIIISRTDSIGDVVLTLPVAGVIKKYFPGCKVTFLCRPYTRPVVELCRFVDTIIEFPCSPLPSPSGEGPGVRWPQGKGEGVFLAAFPDRKVLRLAKEAGIPVRIATARRFYTWKYCNKFTWFSRKNSPLHEAQLNLKMLEAIGIREKFSLEQIPQYYGMTLPPVEATSPLAPLLKERGNKRIILHPKSKGSAREWGLANFTRLIDLVPSSETIYITGTKEEGDSMRDFLDKHKDRVTDLTGKLSLKELIVLISSCDSLVAASTGPLHIAAALGKRAIGLYAPMHPIHPGRWAPVGKDAHYLVLDKECNKCRKTGDCECIRSIRPEQVIASLRSQ